MQNKQLLYDLFKAYYDCRKNKRKTINQLNFELNYESNIINLRQDILNDKYEIGKSIAFIVEKPVKREIFAGDFRDRIIHHYVINKLNPYFEKYFIYDSYSCRIGKGTLFGIKRIEKFIKSCSNNYSKETYILKLDIQGFFMSIDKNILWEKLVEFINNKSLQPPFGKGRACNEDLLNLPFPKGVAESRGIIINLLQKIIFNDPIKNCIIKGDKSNWQGLPKSKSLFFAKPNIGLPIGNLTSQIFANFYLDLLDKYIKQKLKIKYYGRYVDDFILIHNDKEYLKYCKNEIQDFLKQELNLTLHPNKIYLQYFTKGVLFLGSFILPYRTYLKNKTKGNIYDKISILNQEIRQNSGKINNILKQDFRQSINSYLGLIKHNNSYKLRKKILLQDISTYFWNYFYISSGYIKIVSKRK